MTLQQEILNAVEARIAGTENYVVEVKVSPSKITVVLDHPKSLSLDECVAVSRHLQDVFETTDVFEKHELEVTSPGMEEPLKVLPQYIKRLRNRVSVLTFDGLKRTGILESADENGIVIAEEVTVKEGNRKTKTLRPLVLSFSDIKETRVLFSFDKLQSAS